MPSASVARPGVGANSEARIAEAVSGGGGGLHDAERQAHWR